MSYLKGKGVTLAAQFSSPTYTTIAQRVEISGPSRTVETADSTHLDSTAREFVATIVDNGEVSFRLFYDPDLSNHSGLTDLIATPATISWKITFTDATPTTFTFSGILTTFNIGAMTVEGLIEADASIKITGGVTIA